MPYSDPTPVLVLPDTPQGREERRRHIRDAEAADPNGAWPGIALCSDYDDDTDLFTAEYAQLRGIDTAEVTRDMIRGVCRNRDTTGDRRHQWCFRCPAGFAFFAPKAERNATPGQDPATQARIRVQ